MLPVESCPISSPLLNRAIAVLWTLGREGRIPVEISSIELYADAEDQKLQAELYVAPRDDSSAARKKLQSF